MSHDSETTQPSTAQTAETSTSPGDASVPTLYEWMGGRDTLDRLMTLFYSRVPADPLLGPVFASMAPACRCSSSRTMST